VIELMIARAINFGLFSPVKRIAKLTQGFFGPMQPETYQVSRARLCTRRFA